MPCVCRMFEKKVTHLPDLQGDSYRIFEESFARRFGVGTALSEEDKTLLKTSWTKQAKAYYAGLQPDTANRLLSIGSDPAKISAPTTHDAAFLEQAYTDLIAKRMQMMHL